MKTFVLIPQCGSIPDSNGTSVDNARIINSLLSCLRSTNFAAQGGASAMICAGGVSSKKQLQ